KGVATVMKSIISDLTIRINEKNQPRRTAENVMNIIYVTNADMSVQLDTDDRCHLICACKTVHQVTEEHKEDVDYFNELSQSYTQVFYENLMTFLLERDISQFNPTLIPMTEAKKQLINVSRSPVDDVIMEHYEQFKQGIPIALMMNEEDTEMSNVNYQKYKKTIEDNGLIEQVVQETKDE
ncbi:MAG: hypothetical protein EZS28_053608, partial [Streblomastix strix]